MTLEEASEITPDPSEVIQWVAAIRALATTAESFMPEPSEEANEILQHARNAANYLAKKWGL
jgi:hypothetical protein